MGSLLCWSGIPRVWNDWNRMLYMRRLPGADSKEGIYEKYLPLKYMGNGEGLAG